MQHLEVNGAVPPI